MKKLFLLMSVSLALSMTGLSQSQDSSGYIYSELVGARKFLSPKVVVTIDYGQEAKFFSDQRIRDEETGKVKNFNSMIDALNFMGEKGWEFVQAYILTEGNQNTYHWLLKKKKGSGDFIPKTKNN